MELKNCWLFLEHPSYFGVFGFSAWGRTNKYIISSAVLKMISKTGISASLIRIARVRITLHNGQARDLEANAADLCPGGGCSASREDIRRLSKVRFAAPNRWEPKGYHHKTEWRAAGYQREDLPHRGIRQSSPGNGQQSASGSGSLLSRRSP